MMTTTSIPATGRTRTIVLWVLRIVVAGIFLPAGVMKLIGVPAMIHEFDLVGHGQGLRYLAGIMELVGGIAVLVPSVSRWGAALLLLVDIGAFAAIVTVLGGDHIHPFVFAALLIALIYLQSRKPAAR